MASTTTTTSTMAGKRPEEAFFTPPDNIVLEVLYRDINNAELNGSPNPGPDGSELELLSSLNDPKHTNFQPTIFSSWDYNLHDFKSPRNFREYILQKYIKWARTVVRHQTDVVFVSHLLLYFFTALPSAVYLFYDFNVWHGIAHVVYIIWCSGAFTLMMHNHIHNRGVLSKSYSLFDWTFPYLLEPLMGHTWDSYYYHHVKAHHVEGNGPDDLSSTIRYQRDSVLHFLHYELRFLLLCWFDLPCYFIRKGKYNLACRMMLTEGSSYAMMYLLAQWRFKPTLCAILMPFIILRIGLMIGNWGQHCLVDDVSPDSDFRSSITLIDVPVSPDKILPPRSMSRAYVQLSQTASASMMAIIHHIISTHFVTGGTTLTHFSLPRSATPRKGLWYFTTSTT